MKRPDEATLLRLAREAAQKAYSPFSGVKVGAALLTSDGKVYTGCNIENSSFSLTQCAERVAATKAVSAGSRKFRVVVVTSNIKGFTYPCGACRQFLSEFSDGLQVVVFSPSGHARRAPLADLLPEAFHLDADTKGSV